MCPDPEELGPDADSFRHVLDVGSSIDASDYEREDPPDGLWDRIASRLDEPQGPEVAVIGPEPSESPVSTEEDRNDSPAEVTRLDDRRSARWVRVTLAAAAVIVAAATIGVVVTNQDAEPTDEVVASTSLEVLEGPATADAQLIRVDGENRLVIEARDMPPAPAGSHYELWLVDPEVTDPRSLGPMEGTTEVAIPESIDTSEYPVVDISLQQDGTVEHSGHSLLRGTLS